MKTQYSLSVLTVAAALVLAILLAPAHSASAFSGFFNFDGYAQGTPAESIAVPGIQMSSPDSPNAWQVAAVEKYETMSGNVLQNTVCDSELVIHVDSYAHTLSLRFANSGGDMLRMEGWSGKPNAGGTMGFSNNYYGSPNSSGITEGTATEDVQGMDHIVIRSLSGCIAIDDLRLDDAEVIMLPDITLSRIPRLPLPEPLPLPVEPIIILGR